MRNYYLLALLLITQFLNAQLTCDDDFILTGNAVNLGECIQLTSTNTTQQGCTWLEDPVDFTMPFTHTMAMNFGNSDAGADGICLVYQSNSNSTCGINGGGIGSEGIPNSFIVEFDTWDNGPGVGDIANDHAAIDINGVFAPIEGPVDLGNIEDGEDHTVTFNWDPGTMTYEVFFDGGLILTGVFDIITNCFGGNPFGFWGFTSSTGAAFNNQVVCPGLPPVVVADATGNAPTFELPCVGASIELDGSFSDSGPEFIYEWTTDDGNIVSGQFSDMPTIDGPGTYTLTVINTMTLCESTDEVTITQNVLEADIAIPNYLDCLIGEVTLEGNNSTQGSNITYEWTTDDGNIVSTSDDEAVVDAPGTYTLTVVYDDGVNFCTEETTTIVEEDPDVPFAFAFDALLTCDPPFIELDGSLSSEGNSYEYEWTTDDGIITFGENSQFPIVTAEGTYVLVVTNRFSGCTDEYDIFVTADQEPPFAFAEVTEDIGCGSLGIFIDGSQSDFGDNIIYEWSTSNGHIVSGGDTNSPFVDEAGDYYLRVTNTTNGCFEEANVTVNSSDSDVIASIAPATELTCIVDNVILDGSGSTPSTNVSYEWSTMDGLIVGSNDQIQANAGQIGTYQLIVTDQIADCADTTLISVSNNLAPPLAEAGTAPVFQCGDISLDLDGTGSTSNATYSWSTSNGQILSNSTQLNPSVGGPGTYFLEVTSDLNGCSAIDSVIVLSDANVPIVQISNLDTLDCTVGSLQLNASMSSNGTDFSLVWTTPNGNISSGDQSLMPFVDAPGTYQLAITNTSNGCSNNASITVEQDTISPNIIFQSGYNIDCAQQMVTIIGSNASGVDLDYQWTTIDGTIVSGADSLAPIVSAGGTYSLTASNPITGCSTSYNQLVNEDQIQPLASAMANESLDCNTNSLVIDASSSTTAAHIIYQWSTDNGIFVGPTDIQSPTVSQEGQYHLLVINTLNECTDEIDVIVTRSPDNVVASIAPAGTLTCNDETVTVNGSGSFPNSDVAYEWSTSNGGTIVGVDDASEITASSAGDYQLIVTDQTTGCADTTSLNLDSNFTTPIAEAGIASSFNCGDISQELNGMGSSVNDVSYLWTTPNGQILAATNSLMPTIGTAGTYVLEVTNNINGCSEIDSVIVLSDVNLPTVQISLNDTLDCNTSSLTLNALGSSSGNNFSLSWSTADGNIGSGDQTLMPSVDAPGTYQLLITNTDNDCSNNTFITVVQDTISPVISILSDGLIDCNNSTFNLEGNNLSGIPLQFEWMTTDGIIDSGTNSFEAIVSAPGTYQLTAENSQNGCMSSHSALVNIDTIAPIANIAAPIELNCDTDQVNLDGSASSGTAPLSFSWTTMNGALSGDASMNQILATEEGTYELLVQNNINGCSDSISVQVIENAIFPTVAIATPLVLNCDIEMVDLMATASTDSGNMDFTWSTSDGSFIGGENTLTPSANLPGTYTLMVEDTDNNCPSQVSIQVLIDTIPPTATIFDPEELNCAVTSIVLSGENSDQGSHINYQWSTTDGNIISSSDEIFASTDMPGLYQLEVENTNNGCIAISSISVTQNNTIPIVDISLPDTLNCATEMVALDGSALSSQGTEYSYNWETVNGGLVSDSNSLVTSVDEAGEYELIILNTLNHCSDSTTIIVADNYIQPTILIESTDSLDCSTPTVDLIASSPGNNNTQFDWTTMGGNILSGENTSNPTVNQVGTYNLVVTDLNNGCSQVSSAEVFQDDELPVVAIAQPGILNCEVETLILDAGLSSTNGSFTYTWSTTNGEIITGSDSLSPEIIQPGIYTLTVLNELNGCDHSSFVAVEQNIQAPTANAGIDTELNCLTQSAILNGSSSSQGLQFDYQWSSVAGVDIINADSSTPTIHNTGLFTLQITDTENGCMTTDEVLVFQNIPTAIVEFEEPKCYGETSFININQAQGGSPPYRYSIDGGQFFEPEGFFNNLPAGQYQVLVEDMSNCIFESLIEIDQPDSLIVHITEPEIEINYGDSITIVAQSNFLESLLTIDWQHDGGLACDSCLVSIASPLASTQYIIRAVTDDGCKDESKVRIIVRRDRPVYIPSAFSPNGDGDNDFFYVFAKNGLVTNIKSLQVFSRWGQPMFSIYDAKPNFPGHGWDGHLNGQPLSSGVFVYVAEIEFNDGEVEIFKGEIIIMR